MASLRSIEESHVWVSQFPVFVSVFFPGMPRLIIDLLGDFCKMGKSLLSIFERVPVGPLIGAKMCSSEP
jgi:hypothetical protein